MTATFILGLIAAFSLPPYHFWPAGIIAFSTLILILDGVYRTHRHDKARSMAAFQVGFCFGFGFFLVGLYWIGFAFLVDADTVWMLPFAAALMPALLSLFSGAAMALAANYWSLSPHRVLTFSLAWVVFEWLRGNILSGFPWNLVGYSVSDSLVLIQSTSIFGIYGLSLCVVLAFAVPATLFPVSRRKVQSPAWLISVSAIVAVLSAFGVWRTSAHAPQTHADISIRIVQPSFPQAEKWRPENRETLFQTYMSLTQQVGYDATTHVVWPESALPFVLSRAPFHLEAIGEMLGESRSLITGAVRFDREPGTNDVRFFNSVHVVRGGSVEADAANELIVQTYDKHKLVPFGEFVPLAGVFRALGLKPLVDRFDGYQRGPGKRTLPVQGAPGFGPLICYEIIFPGAVTAPDERPGWLVNVTNDAWYGDTAGPKQHLLKARLRAVENGLPVVRAANTGISAIIDPVGRVTATLDYAEVGFLDGSLPVSMDPTIYSAVGDILFWFVIFCSGAFVIISRARER